MQFSSQDSRQKSIIKLASQINELMRNHPIGLRLSTPMIWREFFSENLIPVVQFSQFLVNLN